MTTPSLPHSSIGLNNYNPSKSYTPIHSHRHTYTHTHTHTHTHTYIYTQTRTHALSVNTHYHIYNPLYILLIIGEMKEAVHCYVTAIRLMPNFAAAHSNLGKSVFDFNW